MVTSTTTSTSDFGAAAANKLQRLVLLQDRSVADLHVRQHRQVLQQAPAGQEPRSSMASSMDGGFAGNDASQARTRAAAAPAQGNRHIWDVRATKTPIRDLHIMTHNAKRRPLLPVSPAGAPVPSRGHSTGEAASLSSVSSSNNSSSSSPRPGSKLRTTGDPADCRGILRSPGRFLPPPPQHQRRHQIEVHHHHHHQASGATTTSSPFDRLPDKCLVKVMASLNSNDLVRCSRVSRRFYFLAWEPELWTGINLAGENVDADLALKTIIRLLSRNSDNNRPPHQLSSFVLGGCRRLTDRGLAILARRCPNLARLEIQHCVNVTNGGLMDLLTKCPLIEHLDVTGEN